MNKLNETTINRIRELGLTRLDDEDFKLKKKTRQYNKFLPEIVFYYWHDSGWHGFEFCCFSDSDWPEILFYGLATQYGIETLKFGADSNDNFKNGNFESIPTIKILNIGLKLLQETENKYCNI